MLFEGPGGAVALIEETTEKFNNIQSDKDAVERVQEALATLQNARDLRLQGSRSALKKLARTLHTMESAHAELVATHSSTAHAATITKLDTDKFRTAKAASDAEMEAERLAQQAADLTARLQELELQGLDGEPAQRRRDAVEDEVLLRLKVYRSLGIELERNEREGGAGEFSKAIVRNDRRGDVHVVNMDKKFSRFFYANYFWQTV